MSTDDLRPGPRRQGHGDTRAAPGSAVPLATAAAVATTLAITVAGCSTEATHQSGVLADKAGDTRLDDGDTTTYDPGEIEFVGAESALDCWQSPVDDGCTLTTTLFVRAKRHGQGPSDPRRDARMIAVESFDLDDHRTWTEYTRSGYDAVPYDRIEVEPDDGYEEWRIPVLTPLSERMAPAAIAFRLWYQPGNGLTFHQRPEGHFVTFGRGRDSGLPVLAQDTSTLQIHGTRIDGTLRIRRFRLSFADLLELQVLDPRFPDSPALSITNDNFRRSSGPDNAWYLVEDSSLQPVSDDQRLIETWQINLNNADLGPALREDDDAVTFRVVLRHAIDDGEPAKFTMAGTIPRAGPQ